MQRPALSGFLVALGLACLALACAEEEPGAPAVSAEESARLERAMRSLGTTTKRVRFEVLRTCDKWKHLKRPCAEDLIRIEQLDCWLLEGLPRWQMAQERGLGPWAGDAATMRTHNNCLERRGWRKIKEGRW